MRTQLFKSGVFGIFICLGLAKCSDAEFSGSETFKQKEDKEESSGSVSIEARSAGTQNDGDLDIGNGDEVGGGTIGGGGGTLGCKNDGPRTWGPTPGAIMNDIVQAATEQNIPLPPTGGTMIRGSANSSGGSFRWTIGAPDTSTLTEVCKILGYGEYVSHDSYDQERSSRYPSGKANWHSPGDNYLMWFNGTTWQRRRDPPKYDWTWVANIRCDKKIRC